MKIKLLVAAALTAIAGSAMAQATAFEGFTAGLNVGSVGGTSSITQSVEGIGTATADWGQQSFVPGVELGYNYAATQNIVLAVTATYDFADSKLGQQNISFDADSASINFKGQNRYSINLKPGYVITPSTMVYATVGYNSMTVKTGGFTAAASSSSFSGIGYGLGLAVMATKNIFVKAEFQQINFGSKSITGAEEFNASLKPSLTVGTIGVGYKF
jgi:opacity protein-like surface antigen